MRPYMRVRSAAPRIDTRGERDRYRTDWQGLIGLGLRAPGVLGYRLAIASTVRGWVDALTWARSSSSDVTLLTYCSYKCLTGCSAVSSSDSDYYDAFVESLSMFHVWHGWPQLTIAMSVITALESPIAMEASRDQYDRYRSSITTSPTSTPLTPAFQSLSLSPPGSANRRKSAKPSPYRLRTTSGYSLYVLDDVPKDHQQGMSPTMSPAYGSTSGRSLASAGSISASQSESLPSMNAEELPRTPLFNPVGNDALEITLNNPETAKRLLHFAQSRGCGQNIEFLMQV